jgi:hypothetical protein
MPRKKTHEEFCNDVEKLVGDEYSVIGTYHLSSTKLEMKHNKCNAIYDVRPSEFLRGGRCPECYNHHNRKTKIKTKASQ